MDTFLLVSSVALWVVLLILAFLLLGALRAIGLLNWRLDQIEAIRPSRIGREGLKVGRKAPDFTLPSASGGEQSLSDYAGRKVLLVLTQLGCGPCGEIVPELNRLHDRGEHQVLVVNGGGPEATRQWAAETKARFPVLAQEKSSLSKLYEVYATPFAFLIDEKGIITSRGIVGNRQYLGYVLTGAGQKAKPDRAEAEPEATEKHATVETHSSHSSKEASDVRESQSVSRAGRD